MYFNDILVSQEFIYNNYRYVKNSKCSAKLIEHNRTIYFESTTIVTLDEVENA